MYRFKFMKRITHGAIIHVEKGPHIKRTMHVCVMVRHEDIKKGKNIKLACGFCVGEILDFHKR